MQAIRVQPDGISDELRNSTRWLLWKIVMRDGKPNKEPFQVDGVPAATDDPTTWTDFLTAWRVYLQGGFDGVGYVLGEGTSGIDLDGCRNPETGEIDGWAQEILRRFPTYAEVSPSGTGVKLFVHGTFPTKGKKTGARTGKHNKPQGTARNGKEPGIEAYNERRYFAVTGTPIEGALPTVATFNGELSDWFVATFTKKPPPKAPIQRKPTADDPRKLIERARAYLTKIDPAIDGQRGSDATYHVACVLRCEFGLSIDDSLAAIAEWNARCEPPWSHDELVKKLTDAYENEPITNRLRDAENPQKPKRAQKQRSAPPEADGDPLSPFNPEGQTDLANGRRLERMHGDDLRFCHPWKKFLTFNEQCWRPDESGHVGRLAKHIPDKIFTAALAFDDQETIRFAVRSASSRGITAMLDMVKSEPGIPIQPGDLNRDPMLFNVANGTIDLNTGKLREARREDLITQLSPVEYDPEAGCYHFDRLVERAMDGRQPLIDYLQRLLGYSLTGLTSEQILAIFHGVGANGKTTILNIVLEVMGDYGTHAPDSLLVVKKGEAHPTELTTLFGRRLAVAQETDATNQFNEAIVKRLTGSDPIPCRRMKEDFWTFEPTHKLILATNHKPQVRGTDHAIWRRLRLIPFDVVIPDAEQDKQLPEKLRAERPGILRWMVEGCLKWQREGLGMPEEVKSATAAYRGEQDILAAFIADECLISDACRQKAGDLYAAFREWADRTGEHDPGQRRFGMSMSERGFERKTNNGTWYLGIGLRNHTE